MCHFKRVRYCFFYIVLCDIQSEDTQSGIEFVIFRSSMSEMTQELVVGDLRTEESDIRVHTRPLWYKYKTPALEAEFAIQMKGKVLLK